MKIMSLQSLQSLHKADLFTFPYFYYVYSKRRVNYREDYTMLIPELAHITSAAINTYGHFSMQLAAQFIEEAFWIARSVIGTKEQIPMSQISSRFSSEIRKSLELLNLFCTYTKSASYCEEPFEAVRIRSLVEKSRPDELKSTEELIETRFHKDAELQSIYDALRKIGRRFRNKQFLKREFLDKMSSSSDIESRRLARLAEEEEELWWGGRVCTLALNPQPITTKTRERELLTDVSVGVKPRIQCLLERTLSITDNLTSSDELTEKLCHCVGETTQSWKRNHEAAVYQSSVLIETLSSYSTAFLRFGRDDCLMYERRKSSQVDEGMPHPWVLICKRDDGRFDFQFTKREDQVAIAFNSLCLAEFLLGLVMNERSVCPITKFAGLPLEGEHPICPSSCISA